MKLGISIELYKMSELEEKVAAAAACGFKNCQMFLREVEVTEKNVARVSEVCRSNGLEIGPVGAYANPLRPEVTTMGCNMEKAKRVIELLPMFGSNEIAMWSGSYAEDVLAYSEGNFEKAAIQKLARTSEEILKLLESVNGTLIFETYYTQVLRDVSSVQALLNLVKSDRVKVIIDPPNYISPEEYPKRQERMIELVDRLHTNIGAVHFKDFRLLEDGTWDYPGPGGGIMDYTLLMQKLKEYDYRSWGIIEHVTPAQYASAKSFVESHITAVGAW